MAKLVLIAPNFQSFSHLDVWINHGIGHLYTEVKKAGFDVVYWDARVMKAEEMCARIMVDKEITHVGISVLSVYRDNALALLDFIGEKRPDVIRIVGGVHVTAVPTDFLSNSEYIVVGEGELVIPEILRGNLEKGTHYGRLHDLDSLAYIDRSIFPFKEQPINPCLEKPFATIINSRACPGQCTFCAPISQNLFGKKFKIRSIQHIVGEVKQLIETDKIKSFFLHDDNSISNPKYMEEFCDAIKPLGLSWWCQGRADICSSHPELVESMAEAGCSGMLVGFESGSDRVLDYIHKGVTREQNIRCCSILHDNDMIVSANLMVGFPDEKPSEVLETMTMVEEMTPDLVSICTFTPFPGSFLYDECKEKGLLPDNITQSFWNRGQFEPKIKGPDYEFLRWAVQRMCDMTYKGAKL